MTMPHTALAWPVCALELLPRADRQRLLALCEPFVLADVLCERSETTRHVYFPTDGFISLVTTVDERSGLEVGMIGREGMLGAQLALRVSVTPLRALVQGPGTAWRVGAAPFRREVARSAALQRGLNRYVYVLMGQLATCLRFHLIGPRLTRWLLMTQDRAHADRFRITHEFLAYMLGVRRVGITVAAGALQRRGLIRYHRGELTILDRKRLEAVACDCYAADCKTYSELIR
jgi:CRP-like cAMP-binding protein